MTLNKIRWACRRGMLELDLFLIPFAQDKFSELSVQEKEVFWQLLEESDTDLQQWLVYRNPGAHKKYHALIAKIHDYKKSLPC